jgi:dTDP-4-amino-4,6-dideoxygalactose transaminase
MSGPLDITSSIAERLIRLPLWAGMGPSMLNRVVEALERAMTTAR